MPYTTVPIQQGGLELLFERLRPQEQMTLSYLYPNTHTWDQFATVVRFDEGLANFFPINHVRVFPRWFRLIIQFSLIVGFGFMLYIVIRALAFILFNA